jgi:hypothetical protein
MGVTSFFNLNGPLYALIVYMVLLMLLLSGFVVTDGSCYDYYLLYCCKCLQYLMYLLDHVIFYRLVIWKARLITSKQRLKDFQLKRENKDRLDW